MQWQLSPLFFFLSHLRFPENDFRKKQKTLCPDKLKRLYQLFSLNFASIKSCEKSWAIFREYLTSGFLGIYKEFLVNFGRFLDFARIKFRDSSQIAKLAKFNTREIKWEWGRLNASLKRNKTWTWRDFLWLFQLTSSEEWTVD